MLVFCTIKIFCLLQFFFFDFASLTSTKKLISANILQKSLRVGVIGAGVPKLQKRRLNTFPKVLNDLHKCTYILIDSFFSNKLPQLAISKINLLSYDYCFTSGNNGQDHLAIFTLCIRKKAMIVPLKYNLKAKADQTAGYLCLESIGDLVY